MKKASYVLALVLAVSLLVGCSGPVGKPTVTNLGGLTETGPAQAPTETPEETEEFGLSYDPTGGFNPFACTKLPNRAIMSLLYQRLFVVTSTYEVEKDLCQDYTVSDDLKTWTITLKSARFSDGSAVKASDVAASLEASRGSAIYGSRLYHVVSIEAQDEKTLVVTLDTPYEMLPMLLDIPVVRALDVAKSQPVGSGPYALRGYGENLSLERRADFLGQSLLNQVTIPLYTANSTTEVRDSFQFAGTGLSYTDPGTASSVDYRSDYELYDCPAGILLYLGCNLSGGLFTDEDVRACLTYAIDREALAGNPYHGFAKVATLPADPNSPFYDTSLAAQYSYAPKKFAEVVANKGHLGQEIILLVDGSRPYRVTAAREIAENLRAAGLTVTVDAESGSQYKAAIEEGSFDLYLGEAKLTGNYDMTQFFRPYGDLNFCGMGSETLYDLCLDALENSGNYYAFHKALAQDGRLVPVLVRSYAVYLHRGALPGLAPGMDCVFHGVLEAQEETTEEATPSETVVEPTEPESVPEPSETE